VCAVEDKSMSLINPIGPIGPKHVESTGIVGFNPAPSVFTASIFSSPGVSGGSGSEGTAVNGNSCGGSFCAVG